MRWPSFWTGACDLCGRRMGANSLLLRKPSESGLSVHKSTPFAAKMADFHVFESRHRDRHNGMTERASLKSIEVGTGPAARRIAVRVRDGAAPGLFWLGGFKSDMQGTKAVALDHWAGENGRGLHPVRLFRPRRIRRRLRRRHHRPLAGGQRRGVRALRQGPAGADRLVDGRLARAAAGAGTQGAQARPARSPAWC